MLTAKEVLEQYNIYRCRECRCSTGTDWEFVDFTNNQVIECPQCGDKYYLEAIKERIKEENTC